MEPNFNLGRELGEIKASLENIIRQTQDGLKVQAENTKRIKALESAKDQFLGFKKGVLFMVYNADFIAF